MAGHTPNVHLVEGPVGTGKSTYSSALVLRTNGVHVALDEWFVALFSPDRPASDVVSWYIQRKERTFAMVVPDDFFEMASGLWEAPDDAECSELAINFVSASEGELR